MRQIKTLFVATSYPADLSDWRGLFMRHLAFALARSARVDLSMWTPPGDIPKRATAVTTEDDRAWLSTLMGKGGIAHLLRSRKLAAVRWVFGLLMRLRRAFRRNSDWAVYHLNWLQTALPLPNDGKPALITVLGTDMELLKLPFLKSVLRRQMRRRQVALCPNADWMLAPLSEAFGDLAVVRSVPFGIDPLWYGLQRQPDFDRPVWIVVTRLTRAKLGPLFTWARPLFEGQARELHLFGPMQEEIVIPPWVNYHGPVTPAQLADCWFPSAMGLITLSEHAEGRPQVMLEAMASKLPIVASDIKAHLDFLENDFNGRVCSDSRAFSEAVCIAERPDKNREFGRNAHRWVADTIGTWDDCADRYVDIYDNLLSHPIV